MAEQVKTPPVYTEKRCWPWRHDWQIMDKIETKGWFGASHTMVWCKCSKCGAVS